MVQNVDDWCARVVRSAGAVDLNLIMVVQQRSAAVSVDVCYARAPPQGSCFNSCLHVEHLTEGKVQHMQLFYATNRITLLQKIIDCLDTAHGSGAWWQASC